MQSLDHLLDTISKKNELQNKTGTIYFSKMDLKYANSQIPLRKDTQKNATVTYRFINGFYALTDLPATFQKVMDYTPNNFYSAHAILDDIKIITKGTQGKQRRQRDKGDKKVDKENLAISLQKCEYLQTEITWLRYKINPSAIIPTERKTNAIAQMETLHTLKQLRSFIEAATI